MLKRKAAACILIFSFLFSSAWILDQKGKRDFYLPGAEEVVEVLPLEGMPLQNVLEAEKVDKRGAKIFESREYIRIESRL